MDTTLVAAVIGAIATLSAVWYAHYLNTKDRAEEKNNSNAPQLPFSQVGRESHLSSSAIEFSQDKNLKIQSMPEPTITSNGNEQQIKVLIDDVESYVNTTNIRNEKRRDFLRVLVKPLIYGFLFIFLILIVEGVYNLYLDFYPSPDWGTPYIFYVAINFVFDIFSEVLIPLGSMIFIILFLVYIFLIVPLEFLLKVSKQASIRKYFLSELNVNDLDRQTLLHLRDMIKTSGLDDDVKKITTAVIANYLQESVLRSEAPVK